MTAPTSRRHMARRRDVPSPVPGVIALVLIVALAVTVAALGGAR